MSKPSYTGHAFLSAGFRPMFLLGCAWAAIAMALWLAYMISGNDPLSHFDAVDWHAHELLFGFGSAILCGFLFTAIPNWTGRLPISGTPLAALTALWLLGRLTVTFGQSLSVTLTGLIDVGFLAAICAIIAREILAGKNWRNTPVLLICTVFMVANAVFHIDAASGSFAASGIGFRLGISALIMLIGLIGGRVIPSFTRNWLAKQGPDNLPTPFNQYDKITLLISAATLILWTAAPDTPVTGVALLLSGALHITRLTRWSGLRALRETLVIILHIGYAFVPVGYLMLGVATFRPDIIPYAAGIHAWTAGAVAVMMLAVMTRASLGHTGRPLKAGWREGLIYIAAITAAITRIWASLIDAPVWALHLSATAWMLAFGAFCVFYGKLLLAPKTAPRKPNANPAKSQQS